jgi:hypothetical protein
MITLGTPTMPKTSFLLPSHPATMMHSSFLESLSDEQTQLAYHHLMKTKLLFLGYQLYTNPTKNKPICKHISTLTGAMSMDELIHNTNQTPFYGNMVMKIRTFFGLQSLLEEEGVLYNSKHVKSTEKLTESNFFLFCSVFAQARV